MKQWGKKLKYGVVPATALIAYVGNSFYSEGISAI